MLIDGNVTEVFENQRYWGLTWATPLLPFDWPAWSDAQGNAVQLQRPPEIEGERGWFIVRTPGTDEDGWRYSTVFSKITTPRPGGRSSKRSSDYVRSRVWRKLSAQVVERELLPMQPNDSAERTGDEGDESSQAPGTSALPRPHARGSSLQLPPEAERILRSAVAAAGLNSSTSAGAGGVLPKPSLFKLWQIFMELWNDACARHGMRRLVPLDPLGLYVAARRHKEVHSRLRRLQLAGGRLVAKALHTTEPEPDLLDSTAAAATAAAALSDSIGGSPTAGGREDAAAAAAMAAGENDAGSHHHRSPAVGETPTGAVITQPAPPSGDTGTGVGGSAAGSAGAGAAGGGGAGEGGPAPFPANLSDPQELMHELLTAINYSRAAYGYAMAAGHLASITKLIAMLGSAAHFNPISGASVEANNEAIHLFTGIPIEDIVMAEWRSSVFRPCHYLAVDRARRRIVLAVRGSLELSDIATDLTARPTEHVFGGGLSGHVHQGLMSAATYVAYNTCEALRTAAERFPGWPLLVTGHSLGAGVAGLLTLLLRQPGAAQAPRTLSAVQCLAIAPPAVMSAQLAEEATGFIVSLINDTDFVPRLSCYSVDRALLELVQASPAAQMADNLLQSTGATWAAISQRFAQISVLAGSGGRTDQQQEGLLATSASVEVEMTSVGSGRRSLASDPRAVPGASGRLAGTSQMAYSQGLKEVVSLAAGQHGSCVHGAGGYSSHDHHHHHHHHHSHSTACLSRPPPPAGRVPAMPLRIDNAHVHEDDDGCSAATSSSYRSAASVSCRSRSAASSPGSSRGYAPGASEELEQLPGGLLYRSPHPMAPPQLQLQGLSRLPTHQPPAGPAQAPGGHQDLPAAALLVDPGHRPPAAAGMQFAAMTPPIMSPTGSIALPPPSTTSSSATHAVASAAGMQRLEGDVPMVAAAGEAFNLSLDALFEGDGIAVADRKRPGSSTPRAMRRQSDPLSGRPLLPYRSAGSAPSAAAVGPSAAAGVGVEGAGAWEAISHKLVTSWFGAGYFDDEEEEEEEEGTAGGRGYSRGAAVRKRSTHVEASGRQQLARGGAVDGRGRAGRERAPHSPGAASELSELWGSPQEREQWLEFGTGPMLAAADGLTACWPELAEVVRLTPGASQRQAPSLADASSGRRAEDSMGAFAPAQQHIAARSNAEPPPAAAPLPPGLLSSTLREQQQQQAPPAKKHRPSKSVPNVDELLTSTPIGHRSSAVEQLSASVGHLDSNGAMASTEDAEPDAAAAEEPLHVHSLHKELYPPGRLLWVVYDDDSVAGPSLCAEQQRDAAARDDGDIEGQEMVEMRAAAAGAGADSDGDEGMVSATCSSIGSPMALGHDSASAFAHAAPKHVLLEAGLGLPPVAMPSSAQQHQAAAATEPSGRPVGGAARGVQQREAPLAAPPAAETDGKGSILLPLAAAQHAKQQRLSGSGCPDAATASHRSGLPSVGALPEARTSVPGVGSPHPSGAYHMSHSASAGNGMLAPSDSPALSSTAGQGLEAESGAGASSSGSPGLTAVGFSLQRVKDSLRRLKSGMETMVRQVPLPNLPTLALPSLPQVQLPSLHQVPSVAFLTGMGNTASDGGVGADGRPSGSRVSASGVRQPCPCMYLVEADRTTFERMILIPSCATDHLPDVYFQAAIKLSKGVIMQNYSANAGGDAAQAAAQSTPDRM